MAAEDYFDLYGYDANEEAEAHAGCDLHVQEVRFETAKALLCYMDEDRAEWVPKSLILSNSEVKKRGDSGTLEVEDWLHMKLCRG